MISLVSGSVIEKTGSRLVVQTPGGVGYEIGMTASRVSTYALGQQVSLFTYLKVSDQALDLYGFATREEREFFTLLMTVSGVGPKTAMNVLSLGSIDNISSAIARGDVTYLTAVQGMGKKIAERLVMELKGKMTVDTVYRVEGTDGVVGEVIDGLVALGYDRTQAKEVVTSLDASGKTTEQLLRLALQHMR